MTVPYSHLHEPSVSGPRAVFTLFLILTLYGAAAWFVLGGRAVSHTVFRVQHSDGRGPWSPGFSFVWTDPDRTDLPPTWMEEFPGLKQKPNVFHGCGCKDLMQLRKWFNGYEAKTLSELGFYIARIEADRIIAESENQLVFTTLRPFWECRLRIPMSQLHLAAVSEASHA